MTRIVTVALAALLSQVPGLAAQTEAGGGGGASGAPLAPGDLVRLTFWLDQELSGDYVVDESGDVVLPLVGIRRATASDPLALKESLREAYGDVLRNQDVQILFLRRIRVLGDVGQPGLFHAEMGMTVGDVLAMAEGVKESGDEAGVRLVRLGQTEHTGLDPALLVGTALRSGDQLYVPRKSWLRRNATAVLGTAASITVALIYRGFSR